MFPANQLPEIINENNNASTEPENTKQTKDKRIYFLIIFISIFFNN